MPENPTSEFSTTSMDDYEKQVISALEDLKQASRNIQYQKTTRNPQIDDPAIKTLLELQSKDLAAKFEDPNLASLYHHLCSLRDEIGRLGTTNRLSLRAFIKRRVFGTDIARVAGSIESEIQAWIDRESLDALLKSLRSESESPIRDDSVKLRLISQFENRLSEGFDSSLQDIVLKSRLVSVLQSMLCDESASRKLRERCGSVIASLVRFNRDVFVGHVLKGPTGRVLVELGSAEGFRVLCRLIKILKGPFVFEIHASGEIPKIVKFLDLLFHKEIRVSAFECVLEIGYYGRREAVEVMLEVGLVQKLVHLQRSAAHDDHQLALDKQEEEVGFGQNSQNSSGSDPDEHKDPFSGSVARFAIQLEVGQGLRHGEKREMKQEVLKGVREVVESEAEAATILAEVLWGAS